MVYGARQAPFRIVIEENPCAVPPRQRLGLRTSTERLITLSRPPFESASLSGGVHIITHPGGSAARSPEPLLFTQSRTTMRVSSVRVRLLVVKIRRMSPAEMPEKGSATAEARRTRRRIFCALCAAETLSSPRPSAASAPPRCILPLRGCRTGSGRASPAGMPPIRKRGPISQGLLPSDSIH